MTIPDILLRAEILFELEAGLVRKVRAVGDVAMFDHSNQVGSESAALDQLHDVLASIPGLELPDDGTAGFDVEIEGHSLAVAIPVFTDSRFNPEAAATLDEGYGTALMNAMERMIESDATLKFASRKQLADFLQRDPSPMQQGRHGKATGYVDAEAGYLVDAIVSAFGDVLAQAGATTEAVYVYGGGSGPIKEMLHPALLKAAGDIPVLYLDASYSRHLNREGLYLAARTAELAASATEQK